MMISFTPEQQQAIDAENCGIIVSAAAGSGKTAVLVERLVRIISDSVNKVPADRIIVVTFTNDAAMQMKQRLSLALLKRLEEEPDNLWLMKQQANIQAAKICTIHSFCFDLIRENIHLLELSPGFRIIDENEEKLITYKAVETVIEKLCAESPEDKKILTDFFCTRGDRQLEETVLKLYKFLLSVPFWREWLDDVVDGFEKKNDFGGKVFSEYTENIAEEFSSLATDAAIACGLAKTIDAEKACVLIADEEDMFRKIADGMRSKLPFEEKMKLLGIPSFDRISFPKYEAGSEDELIKGNVTDIRDSYKDKVNKLYCENIFTPENIAEDRKIHFDILSRLAALVKAADDEIFERKLEKNAIGFSDAEQLAARLLAVRKDGVTLKTPLAESLSAYYKEIMIDEFQDVNNMQFLIFRQLSKDGKNLFAVGDVKQSIYRFRLANPKIFVDTLDISEKYTEEDTADFSSILLNKNFRSGSGIIDFVNFIFKGLMTRRVGEIDYTDDEKLFIGDETQKYGSKPEIIIVNSDEAADEEDGAESSETICTEAKIVAARIKKLIDEGATVNENGEKRLCAPRDFCVLLRKKASGQIFAAELERCGIRAATEEVDGYLRSREMSVLLNLLRVVDNPLLEIPLTSVLMSPMFMLTAEDMAEIRILLPKENLYRAVLAAKETPDASYYGKITKFCDMLEKLRLIAAGYSLEKLIGTIYDNTDYLSVIQLYRDGKLKKANLRLLLEYARSYEENHHGGLSGFLRYINAVSEHGGDFKKAGTVSYSDDAVNVKTIHKSKGLEFPFVFLCMTSTKFNKKDLSAQLQLDADEGIGLRIQKKRELKRYNSVFQYNIREKNRRYLVSEELRLLYVALTRAKERLFITLDVNEKSMKKLLRLACNISINGGISEKLASGADSMQDWLAMCLLLHPQADGLRNLLPITTSTALDAYAPDISMTFSDDDAVGDAERKKAASVDKDKLNALKECISTQYDSRLTNTPAKLSVTEIVNGGEEITLRRPRFTAEKGKLSGAEKGTATHLFMQYCNFSNAERSVADECGRLREAGILGLKESGAIETEKLERFFTSDLFARMKSSEKIERERKFLVKIDELSLDGELGEAYNGTDGMLQGVADCIFEEDGGYVLVDYKTDFVRTESELTDKYSSQLLLYKAALDMIYDGKVRELIIYSFGLGKEISIK